jgi:hypothetical protein
MLGAAVPTRNLVHAATITKPSAVVLWAQQPQTARSETLRALGLLPLRRITAGPGWPRQQRAGVDHVGDLPAALELLAAASTS